MKKEKNNPEKKKRRFIIPIGFKLISMISLIILAALSLMTLLATYNFTQDNEVRIRESSHKLAQVVGLKVEADLRTLREKGTLIVSSLLKEQGSEEDREWSTYISELVFQSGADILFTGIARKSPRGVKLVKGVVNRRAAAGNDEKVFNRAIAAESKLFAKSFDAEEEIHNSTPRFGEPVLGISYPYVRVSEKKADSIVIMYVRTAHFLDAVKSIDIEKTFIVNGRGDLLAHSDLDLIKGQTNFSHLRVVNMMMKAAQDNGQTEYTDPGGKAYLGAFKRTSFGNTGVVSTVPRYEAFKAVRSIERQNIYITVIVLGLAMLIVYFFAKTLTVPVRNLVGASRQIEEGDFALSIRPTTRDEIGLLTESFVSMGEGLAEREKMKDALGKFVNKEIAEMALRAEIKLGGERKSVAIFFSDIRSFTAISERLEPEEVVEFLNEYMTRMVGCVNETNGVVDKFIGDAIMAIWGTPVSYGNDTENALNAALMMRRVLYQYNEERAALKKPLIKIGCGINCGDVVAGQIGSHDRMEYTVIGDAVNLASRIEGLNKPFGTDILVSQDARDRVKDIFHMVPMQKIRVKGKQKPQQVYAVLGRKDDNTRPKKLKDLRKSLGVNEKDLKAFDPDQKEEKYEIIG